MTHEDGQLEFAPVPRWRTLVVSAVFVAATAIGPFAWLIGPAVKTRAARPWPTWSAAAFRRGEWTEELRLHLRETSAVTATIRGVTTEALYLLGLLEPDSVALGRGGAMFAKFTLSHDISRAKASAVARVRFLSDLRAWSDARDVAVFCVVVPDKIRVMPERIFADGVLPERKQPIYAAMTDELRSLGFETVDLDAAMRRWRAERPDEALYFERDTHWSDAGAWRASRLVAERLDELGWLDGIPPAPIVTVGVQESIERHDLADLLGFSSDGLFAGGLAETRRHVTVRIDREGGLSTPIRSIEPTAGIALCGDSFSASLAWGLSAATGRLVDFGGSIAGEGPLVGLVDTVGRIEAGELASRVIVWEMIERSYVSSHWDAPPDLPRTRGR